MQQAALITEHRAGAYVASALRLLSWLLNAILRAGLTGRSMRLQRLLNRAESAVEQTLFLKAVARYGPRPKLRHHPRAAPPPGIRRVARDGRSFFRSVKIRARTGSPLMRVLALIDALTRPERAIAYFLKQMRKGLRLSGLVVAAPPALMLIAMPFITERALCDSS